jgi:hypothetical protein
MVKVEDFQHFFFWSNPELLEQAARKMTIFKKNVVSFFACILCILKEHLLH